MHDFTLCSGHECPKRSRCHRARVVKEVPPDDMHKYDYFGDPPYDEETDKCEFFWYVRKGEDPYLNREIMLKSGDKGYDNKK